MKEKAAPLTIEPEQKRIRRRCTEFSSASETSASVVDSSPSRVVVVMFSTSMSSVSLGIATSSVGVRQSMNDSRLAATSS